MITSECFQESDNLLILFIGKRLAKLNTTHDIDCLGQRICGPVVKVGIGEFNGTQGRHLEAEAVSIVTGDRRTTSTLGALAVAIGGSFALGAQLFGNCILSAELKVHCWEGNAERLCPS